MWLASSAALATSAAVEVRHKGPVTRPRLAVAVFLNLLVEAPTTLDAHKSRQRIPLWTPLPR